MKVYEAVANAFIKEGTTKVFGLLGDGQMPWWATMAKHPDVQMIDVRHEATAVTMAEGYARVTGKVGVCSGTHGPGLSHMTSSLINASRFHSPLVVYTSRTPFHNENAAQFLDQERLVGATGAGYIELLRVDFAESAVREAFYRAKLESKPYVLCVPRDIQTKDCDADGDDYRPSSTLFRGQQKIQPDVDLVNEAAELIKRSKKPVVLLGQGAMSPQAKEAAERLAKTIGALTSTTLLAKGIFQQSDFHAGISGLFSTRTAIELFQNADCVIAVGATLNQRTLEGGYLFPNAKMIQIDVKSHMLMGNAQSAHCYIQGDSVATLFALNRIMGNDKVGREGYRTAEVKALLANANHDPAKYEIEPGTVDPREAVRLIDECLPEDVAFVTGSGHTLTISTMEMRKPRFPSIYITGAWGCIGQGIGAAIGAAVGLNGRAVLHMEGDGGAMQNIQELDTAARLKLKILFVIMNDEGFGAEYQKLKAEGGDTNIATTRSPDFAKVADGLGCCGRTARRLDEIKSAVTEFRAGKYPMVLDIRTSRNVISIPYRRLYLGEDA